MADATAMTPEFVGSYAGNLVHGQENDDGKLVFSVRADFDPATCKGFDPADPKSVPDWAKEGIKAAIEAGKVKKWNGKVPNGLKMPLLDGDDSGKEELEGLYYMNLKSYGRRPPIVGPDGKAMDPDLEVNDETIYSGAKFRAKIQFAPYDHKGNKGIGAYVVAIQKVADGERKSGGISASQAEDMFGAVEGDTEAALEDDFLS